MALSTGQSRGFVVFIVVLMIGLALLATVLITRGMNDESLQERVRQLEEGEGR